MEPITQTYYDNLYAEDGDVRYAVLTYTLNATEQDEKYRKKYTSVWKK